MPISIKQFRQKEGYTQNYVAKYLDISRPTYVQIESGKRDLTLKEAQKLAKLFNLPLDKFLEGSRVQEIDVALPPNKVKIAVSKKQDIRISVPRKNLEKFKEVFLYILEKVGAKPNVGETVIYKLLYFIDFDFYEKYEKQLIGATYIKNHHGPTPVEFAAIANDMQKSGEIEKLKSKYFQYPQKKYLPLRGSDLSKLSALEKEHIDDVLVRLSDKSAKELSEYSHEDIPWKIHESGEVLSYESVFYRDYKYSVRNYEDDL